MHRQIGLTVAVLVLLLGGCAAPGAPVGNGPDAALRFNGFCRCTEVADLVAYHQRIRAMSGEELAAEYTAASQILAKQKSDVARLRLAMLFSVPGASFRDDGRAAALAEEVASRKSPDSSSGLRPLASLIAANANEQRRQDDRSQKLAQKLQEEEKRADALQQKLDGLKAIEKNLLNREPTKPVKVK